MSLGALLVAITLVVVNGFFVAVEFAFTASRRPTMEEMAAAGNRFARWAVASMNELPVTFAGAQLGIAGASLGLGFVIENSLEVAFHGFYDFFGLPSGAVTTLSLLTALVIVSFVHNVFGEMAPKNATIAAPERAALIVAAPFRAYVTVFRPIIFTLSSTAAGVLRLFGVRTRNAVEVAHSADDIATLVKTIGAGGVIDPSSSRLLTSALKFQDTVVSEVMVPRPDLVAMPASATAAEFEEMMVNTGHSRIPVHTGDLDDIIGFVHVKDLMGVRDEVRDRPISPDLIRETLYVPESAHIRSVLDEMRESRIHFAIVIDEHGSTAGIITMEDIAEELVGEIRDEHDPRERRLARTYDGRIVASGLLRPDQLAQYGVDLPEGDYETIGGLIMDRLGRLPSVGDVIEEGEWRLRVTRTDGRRVSAVELNPLPKAGD